MNSMPRRTERFADLAAFVEAAESPWRRDLDKAGALPGLTDLEPSPWNEILGPVIARGDPAGMLVHRGELVFEWGNVDRVEMTFSVAKSYLALLAGVAVGDGRIASLDDRVADAVAAQLFVSEQNHTITWRHLLEQTSEWEGTLWSKPDLADRNRQVGPTADNSRKGQHRDLQPPGTLWEYNDVRVNLLALCLTHVFGEALDAVLARRIMAPLGASDSWRWHAYHNAFTTIGEQRVPSVPGGTHWGGGLHISTRDHMRVARLVRNEGAHNGEALLPPGWTTSLRQPCHINAGYGLLWWLNPNREVWPAASANAFAAIGAGAHVMLIDPDRDLVLVARWFDAERLPSLVEHAATACE